MDGDGIARSQLNRITEYSEIPGVCCIGYLFF
jgi:hypothetical protein